MNGCGSKALRAVRVRLSMHDCLLIGTDLNWNGAGLSRFRGYLHDSLSDQSDSFLPLKGTWRLEIGGADSIPSLARIALCSHGGAEKIKSDPHWDVVRSP